MKKDHMIRLLERNCLSLEELLERIRALENKLNIQNESNKILQSVDTYHLTNVEMEQIQLLESEYLNHIPDNEAAKNIVIFILKMLTLERKRKK